ncbi:hypothetical protein F5146DRAFT_1226030, partial [Armillaria mellea]
MSFYDGILIASVLDGVDTKDIIKLLKDHEIWVGPSIINNREYLYYFIGNCNDTQQDAFRTDAVRQLHGVDQLRKTLLTSLLAYIVGSCQHHSSVVTHYTREQLLNRLDGAALESIIRDRQWYTSNPTFIDGSSVKDTLRLHRKDGIIEALRSVSPTAILPADLLRESKDTIFRFCSLLDADTLSDFRQHLHQQLQPVTFSDGTLVSKAYEFVTTPILQW